MIEQKETVQLAYKKTESQNKKETTKETKNHSWTKDKVSYIIIKPVFKKVAEKITVRQTNNSNYKVGLLQTTRKI